MHAGMNTYDHNSSMYIESICRQLIHNQVFSARSTGQIPRQGDRLCQIYQSPRQGDRLCQIYQSPRQGDRLCQIYQSPRQGDRSCQIYQSPLQAVISFCYETSQRLTINVSLRNFDQFRERLTLELFKIKRCIKAT